MINTSFDGGVFVVTFNRPEVHNAFDDAFGLRFHEALLEAHERKDVRVVVLRGEGRSFCSGRDLRQMGERAPGVTDYDLMTEGQKKIRLLVDMGKPVIAALKGAVIGGGCEYALAADIRLAAPDTRIALPEVTYGLAVDQGGSALAESLIGPSRTKWMLMTGRSVDADTALRWGLVDEIVPLEQLDESVMKLAAEIAGRPWRAVRAAKELVDELWAPKIRAAIQRELVYQLALFGSEDFIALRDSRRAARAQAKNA